MPRRTETEILIDILIESLEGCTKTKILHRTNLNAKSFSKYFQTLKDRDLIESQINSKNQRFYRTTEHGKELLKKMLEVQETLGKETTTSQKIQIIKHLSSKEPLY